MENLISFIKKGSFFYLVILAMGTMFSCGKESVLAPEILTGTNNIELENELIAIVNAHRSEIGKGSLLFCEVAYRHANAHTNYMISKGSLNHDNFETRASSVALEVEASTVSENVAKGYSTAQEAFNHWYGSAEHRKAIDGDYTHTAASIKMDEHGTIYYTQMFYR